MQIAFHAGLHQTESDVLLKTLLRNRGGLQKEGIVVPGPGKYRKLLSKMLNAMEHNVPSQETRDVFLDTILIDEPSNAKRLILSHENFFSVPKITFQGGQVYRKAENRLKLLETIFENDSLEIFISIRNPATFLPALLQTTPHENLTQLMSGLNPTDFLWSNFIERISSTLPNVSITVWCYEDSPFIWRKIMLAFTAVNSGYELIGSYSRFSRLISKEGLEKFRKYLSDNPKLTEEQSKAIMIEYFERYALQEEIDYEPNIPTWTQEFIEELSYQYDQDLFRIEQLSNVSVIHF